MRNWRRILVTGMVAGMIAVTGCSSNVPETNQGNRNGQRVVDAVNRRTDSYGLTRARNTGERTMRGFNRGFRRATRNNNTARTRHYNHVAHPGLIESNNHYRNPGVGSPTRSTHNRNTNHINRGRVGHTFGYDQNEYANGLAGEYAYGGYDLGRRTDSQLDNTNVTRSNNLNNRVVRSTPARNTATHNRTANTTRSTGIKRSTTTNVTRSTNVTNNTAAKPAQPAKAAKVVQPTRSTTRNTQPVRNTNVNRSNTSVRPAPTAAPSVTPSAPRVSDNVNNVTHHMLHNTNTAGTVAHAAPVRSNINRPGSTNQNQPTKSENLRNQRENARAKYMKDVGITPVAPYEKSNPVVNPGATRNINRTGQNRSNRRATARREGIGTSNKLRINSSNTNNGRIHRSVNDSAYHGQDFYMTANDAHKLYGGVTRTGFDHSVPVSTLDDNNDYAFFKRNKTDDVPATPQPASNPQAPAPGRLPTRSNNPSQQVPAPAASPAPTSMAATWNEDNDRYDETYDDIHDLDDATINDHNNLDNIAPLSDTNPYAIPVSPARRAMK